MSDIFEGFGLVISILVLFGFGMLVGAGLVVGGLLNECTEKHNVYRCDIIAIPAIRKETE